MDGLDSSGHFRDKDTLILAEGVSKKFCTSLKRSMMYGSIDALCGMVGLHSHSDRLRSGEFWALDDVSFELKRGESLGLLGRNGCGKTTLLRLLHGIFPLDAGRIVMRGRVGALIAVGAGFHPHMTGRENIRLNATLMGLSRTEVNSAYGKIVEFADIGDFLEAPVSTYSSGMRVRLGIAIAIHANVDILLIDEVLAVGDMAFRGKCYNKLNDLKKNGVAIILVSHESQNLLDHCRRGLLLHHGRVVTDTGVFEAVKEYERILINESTEGAEPGNFGQPSPLKMEAFVTDSKGDRVNAIGPEAPVAFNLHLDSEQPYEGCSITLTVMTADGFTVLRLRNDFDGMPLIALKKGRAIVRIHVAALHLDCGVYNAFFVVCSADKQRPLLQHAKIGALTVSGNEANVSVVRVSREWRIS